MRDVNIDPRLTKQLPAGAFVAARILLVVFLIPFIAVGAFVAFNGVQQLQKGAPAGSAVPLIAFGLIFLAIPVGIVASSFRAMKRFAADATFRRENADRPWLWRKEWSEGALVDHAGSGSTVFVVMAVIFAAVSSPIFFVLRREIAKENYVALIALVFPIIAAGLLVAGIYRALRKHKYGVTIARLDRVPIEPGRPARVELLTHVTEPPDSGFLVKLTCVRRQVSGSGRNRSTSESILWRDEQTVRAAAPSPDGMRVPVTLSIPADAQPSDERLPGDRVIWRLDVTAEVPGIDYAAQFELPVFNLEGRPEEAREVAHVPVDLAGWRPEGDSLITITPSATGEEIRVRGHARLGEAFGLGVFNLVWFGFVALMFRLHAPFIFALLFAGFGLIILALFFDFVLGRTTIRASRNALSIRRSWLGVGSARNYDPAQIKSVTTVVGMTSGGGSGTPFYNVRLRIKDGKETFAAKYIRSRRDAEALAAKIAKDCGVEPSS